MGELRDFITASVGGATCDIDTNGNLVITADTEGEANIAVFIQDDAAATGNTLWPNFSVTTDGTGPDSVTTSASIFDSQGVSHTLVLTFNRVDSLTWSMAAESDIDGTILNNIGNILFQSDGSYLTTTGAGGGGGSNNSIEIQTATGTNQVIYLDFGSTGQYDGLSQVGDTGAIQVKGQDGFTAGTLSTVSVEPDGSVLGHYTNGQFLSIAQIGLALFNNPSGLEKRGDSLFTTSPNSGTSIQVTPGTSSAGNIVAGSLEQSNVDIGEEFVHLIEAQRGFQASARIISTADEVLVEVVNLIR
jgi:flagellar hook protein FlgE